MKYFLIGWISILCLSNNILLANSSSELFPVAIDLHDKEALQRGAKLFMNYCSGCHSLRYLRYNRMANDIGLMTFDGEIDKDLLVNNLIFTRSKPEDPIEISMPSADARQWFGVDPPDLSLEARKRSPEWIFTYLKSFYADSSRPFGTNNILIPGVAMPNILEPLAGKVVLSDPQAPPSLSQLVLIKEGGMTEQEFDNALEDLVTFLAYVGDPVKITRHRIGVGVLIFLSILLLVVYRLKKVYWKNLHRNSSRD